ncbi:MAG: hypothetical protein Q6370_021300 [Candidatus Sigynarchaeota archaeon]
MGNDKRKPSRLVTWVVLPTLATIVLIVVDHVLDTMVEPTRRMVTVFLVAWLLYFAVSCTRTRRATRRALVTSAIMAIMFVLSLAALVVALVTGSDPLVVDGRYLDLRVCMAYMIVFIVLDVLAIAFTRITVK